MKKGCLKERRKPCLHTPGQSVHNVGMIVRLFVSESYKNCQTQTRGAVVGKGVSDAARHTLYLKQILLYCIAYEDLCMSRRTGQKEKEP